MRKKDISFKITDHLLPGCSTKIYKKKSKLKRGNSKWNGRGPEATC